MRFFFSKPKETRGYDRVFANDPAQELHSVVHTISETGPVRTHNEDHLCVHFFNTENSELLCVVADGMGGHQAGEVASKIACDTLLEYLAQSRRQMTGAAFQQAFLQAHQYILDDANAHAGRKGMGTTATAVLIKNNRLLFGHIGDSRLYHFAGDKLIQLTRDDTLVNDMYEKGEITKEERDHHSMKNVLTQALGTLQVIHPQCAETTVSGSDKLLLCSDGLYDVFSENELEDLLRMKDQSFALECIRTLAYKRTASDNFSAILISFSDDLLPVAPITKEQTIPT